MFIENRCVTCGSCVATCTQGAQILSSAGREILWNQCDNCGACVQTCPSRALTIAGEWFTVDQVMNIVKKDMPYYQASGGGVTFSGGEPMIQPDFLSSCLERCHQAGIHTAVDTSGSVPWTNFRKVLAHTDLFLYDLKHMDNAKHKALIGVGNELILDNLQRLDRHGKSIWIRIPLIPGHNDSTGNLLQAIEFIKNLKHVERISLLSFNEAAGAKYIYTGKTYNLQNMKRHTQEQEQTYFDIFSSAGIRVQIGR